MTLFSRFYEIFDGRRGGGGYFIGVREQAVNSIIICVIYLFGEKKLETSITAHDCHNNIDHCRLMFFFLCGCSRRITYAAHCFISTRSREIYFS